MTDPSSIDQTNHLIDTLSARSRHQHQPQPVQPLQPDEAAAVALSLITDPTSPVMPADALHELTRRNAALLEAPADEIRETLSRQAVLLEASATKYMTLAANASRTGDAERLLKLSLSASRSLVNVLAALHAVTRDKPQPVEAIDGE